MGHVRTVNVILKALVALVQGRACGLLATSSDLELSLLQNCFELDNYEHLVKVGLVFGLKNRLETKISTSLSSTRNSAGGTKPKASGYFIRCAQFSARLKGITHPRLVATSR